MVLKSLTLVQIVLPKEVPSYIFLKFFFTCKSFSQKNYHIFLSSLIFDLNMEIMCPNHLKRVYLNSDPPIGEFGYYLLGFWETSFEVCAYSQKEIITFLWKWFTMEAHWRGRLGMDVVAIRKCYLLGSTKSVTQSLNNLKVYVMFQGSSQKFISIRSRRKTAGGTYFYYKDIPQYLFRLSPYNQLARLRVTSSCK